MLDLVRSKKITDSAKGKDCTLRIYPHCEENPETTVFCHAPSSFKGISIKSPDHWGAYGCHTCHMIMDGQIKSDLNNAQKNEIWLRAICETQLILITLGLLNLG